MKIKILRNLIGTPGYKAGQILEVDEKEAFSLISAKYAAPIVEKLAENRETAMKTPTKTGEKR